MKNFQISEDTVKNILLALDEIPTKYGRTLQDFFSKNLIEIKEEKTEEVKIENVEEIKEV